MFSSFALFRDRRDVILPNPSGITSGKLDFGPSRPVRFNQTKTANDIFAGGITALKGLTPQWRFFGYHREFT
jgi:hypothetical protein